ncbi:hypothetical protein THRCLA_00364 [Thraustotheca clavata]|uniref:AMP-dependent synthetase/ligase domain-containing protein n=1 Tax=Thraustotheca clavata TaxID=74557 RepID=A0A1W0ABJ7_9STRA|nr:hypothetical protein THRCLA_00364 [Thraustotheca clavata]
MNHLVGRGLRVCVPVRLMGTRSVSTIGDALESAVATLPHREALRQFSSGERDADLRMSYAELNKYVDELANGFLDLQFKHGDTIALWLPNNIENVVAQFAAAKAGLTVASIDRNISSAEEVAHIVKDSNAVALLFENKIEKRDHASIAKKVFEEQDRNSNLHVIITTSIEESHNVVHFQHILINGLEPHIAAQRRSQINAATPAVISYKSNNGQQPIRTDIMTHGDVLKKAQELASSVKLAPSDKIAMSEVPPGFLVASVAAALKNAQVVIASTDRLDHALQVENCSIVGDASANFKRV